MKFLVHRWFLMTLVLVLVIGIVFASDLRELSELKVLQNSIVAAVLFLMALPLEAQAMWRSLMRPGPPMLAVAVNLGLLPLVAWAMSPVLRGDLGPGLLVAATMPCTLASASVWTRRAGGNDAVSILVTIITNSICFLVTPLWLVAMTGKTVESPELSLGRMSVKLGLLVVLPMAIAQAARVYRPLGRQATRHKSALGGLAQFGILSMIFLGAIHTGLRLQDETAEAITIWDVMVMIASVVGLHVAMLGTGVLLARVLAYSREDQIAVAFACSQKTLPVGLLVAVSLQVTILPMVAYHVGQLFIDTIVADHFRGPGKPAAVSDTAAEL